MVRPRVSLVADDFTGANDAAGRFAARGWRTWAAIEDTHSPEPANFSAMNAKTRFLEPEEAQRQSACTWKKSAAADWWFQKVDSTLRGWPGREILGLLQEKRPRFIAFCPAYPRHGRQVKAGELLVHGQYLKKTEYALDPLSPAKTGQVEKLFPKGLVQRVPLALVRRGSAVIAAALKKFLNRPRPRRIFAFDCEREEELIWIAKACLRLDGRAFAGASGLAGALAFLRGAAYPAPWQGPTRGLVLAGSVSATALMQAAQAFKKGHAWETVGSAKVSAAVLRRWHLALRQPGTGLVLSTIEDRKQINRENAPEAGARALNWLAEAALKLGAARGQRACLLTGGHTAELFFEKAGLVGNWIHGELEPGLPWGLALGKGKKAWIATKPGGFGDPGTFVRYFKKISQ